jgi:hypothetical protein
VTEADERDGGSLEDRSERDRIHLARGGDHEGGDTRDEGALFTKMRDLDQSELR